MITAPCSWVLAHYGRYGTAADTMIRYRDTIWVISSPVCGILICVKWREEGVAASVQLRPSVRVGPALRPTPLRLPPHLPIRDRDCRAASGIAGP